jgi:subtilisin family serine protease
MALGGKVGAAPGARLFAAFGVTDMNWLIMRGAEIINNSTSSFVGNMMFHTSREYSNLPTHFLNAIKNSKAVLVSAAMNDGVDLSVRFNASYSDNTSCLEYPDEAENYLVVGAFEKALNKLASYSNYPGHLKAFQDRFLVTGDGGYDVATAKAPDSYYIGSAGTSNSAPMVSGALAILLEVNPRLSAIQAAKVLLDTADRPASLGYGTTCSSTTPKGTFATDCGAMKFGRGLMNVPKAIEVAKTM